MVITNWCTLSTVHIFFMKIHICTVYLYAFHTNFDTLVVSSWFIVVDVQMVLCAASACFKSLRAPDNRRPCAKGVVLAKISLLSATGGATWWHLPLLRRRQRARGPLMYPEQELQYFTRRGSSEHSSSGCASYSMLLPWQLEADWSTSRSRVYKKRFTKCALLRFC